MERFGFAPDRLKTGTSDLSHFPLNVLFVAYKRRGVTLACGTVLCDPVLATFSKRDDALEMQYANQFCDHCRVKLRYELATGIYTGQKFIGDRLAWETTDVDWNSFFGWLTAVGLANGERCRFEIVPSDHCGHRSQEPSGSMKPLSQSQILGACTRAGLTPFR